MSDPTDPTEITFPPDFPPELMETARKFPEPVCVRWIDHPLAHLRVNGYLVSDGKPCIMAVHGQDSTLPGVKAPVPADELEVCNCGTWQWPTPAQIEETRRRFLG